MDVGRAVLAHPGRMGLGDVPDVRGEAIARIERVHPPHSAVADDLGHDRGSGNCGALLVAVDDCPMRRRGRPSRNPSTRQISAGGESACNAERSPARFMRCRPLRSIASDEITRTAIRSAQPTPPGRAPPGPPASPAWSRSAARADERGGCGGTRNRGGRRQRRAAPPVSPVRPHRPRRRNGHRACGRSEGASVRGGRAHRRGYAPPAVAFVTDL